MQQAATTAATSFVPDRAEAATMQYSGGGNNRRGGVRGGAQAIGGLVASNLDRLQIARKIKEHTAPLVWAEVVGPQLAGATEVIGIENGVLRVSTRSSMWATELTFYKLDIIARLNTRLGAPRDGSAPLITDIHFVSKGVGRNKETDAPAPLAPSSEELDDIELSASEMATIEQGIVSIGDEELRAKLRRARFADARLRTWRLDNAWTPCPGCGDLTPPRPGDASKNGDTRGHEAASDERPCARCRNAAATRRYRPA